MIQLFSSKKLALTLAFFILAAGTVNAAYSNSNADFELSGTLYAGTLFETSGQTGGIDVHSYYDLLKDHDVDYVVNFFGVDEPPSSEALIDSDGLGKLAYAVQENPGMIVPFMGTTIPSDEVKAMLGTEFTNLFKENYPASEEIVGSDIIQGFGEIEQYAWNIEPNSSKLTPLYDYAESQDLSIMFHPSDGQADSVGDLLAMYPDTKFLIHMFHEDFADDRSDYIDLMDEYDNLYFSIDADHMMHDQSDDIGLLYKYENDDIDDAVEDFLDDYEDQAEEMLETAVDLYKPLVDAHPDRVMWGTESGPAYNFEPEVYERVIEFSRAFIGALDVEDQAAVAHQNALEVFGSGVTLQEDLTVYDTSDWPACSVDEEGDCDDECGLDDEACFVACLIEVQCSEEGDGEDDEDEDDSDEDDSDEDDENPFTDLDDNAEYYEAIIDLYERGVVSGNPDGTVTPEVGMNRAELMKIIVAGLGLTPESSYKDCFSDVADDWYAPYVCYGSEQDWVGGYPDGSFNPGGSANNVEVLKMILNVNGVEVPEAEAGEDWYEPYVETAIELELISEAEFSPGETATRGYAFMLLSDLLNLL